jgi:nitrate/nitrite transporter NarK
MFYLCRRSDRSGNRTMYVVTAFLMSAVGLIACSLIGPTHPMFMMLALIFGIMGQMSIMATFWSLPTAMLSGVAAAGGIALINSVGNMGGFVAPYMFGLIKDASGGSDHFALLALSVAPIIAAVVLLAMGHDRRLERIPAPESQRERPAGRSPS